LVLCEEGETGEGRDEVQPDVRKIERGRKRRNPKGGRKSPLEKTFTGGRAEAEIGRRNNSQTFTAIHPFEGKKGKGGANERSSSLIA